MKRSFVLCVFAFSYAFIALPVSAENTPERWIDYSMYDMKRLVEGKISTLNEREAKLAKGELSDSDLGLAQVEVYNLLGTANKCMDSIAKLMADPATANKPVRVQNKPTPLTVMRDTWCGPGQKIAKEKLEKLIDAMKWPADEKVAGAAGIKAAAKKYWVVQNKGFASAYKVEDLTVVGVAIRGNWGEAASNIHKETTQWGVPVWVAVTNKALRAEGIAKVFDTSLRTAERRHVKKGPPFVENPLSVPFYIKLDKLPKK